MDINHLFSTAKSERNSTQKQIDVDKSKVEWLKIQ